MIEYTGNVIIGSGGLDMLIPTNGTLLILQQTTWRGLQGFQRQPDSEVSTTYASIRRRHLVWIEVGTDDLPTQFFSPYPIESTGMVRSSMAGVVGTWGRERGLTFYEVHGAGHELPRYDPSVSMARWYRDGGALIN
jgi:carboxypeptidase D